MVTVWPVVNAAVAASLVELEAPSPVSEQATNLGELCRKAIDGYDFGASERAFDEATVAESVPWERYARPDQLRRGPYLLAWAPTDTKGKVDALVLVADLTCVEGEAGLAEALLRWRKDIEWRPEVWSKGWILKDIQQVGQRFFNAIGSHVIFLLAPDAKWEPDPC